LRPSVEQVSAQKGCKRLEMLLESILRHTKFKSVLIINLTGYVEDLAVAAAFLPIMCNVSFFCNSDFFKVSIFEP